MALNCSLRHFLVLFSKNELNTILSSEKDISLWKHLLTTIYFLLRATSRRRVLIFDFERKLTFHPETIIDFTLKDDN